MHPRFRVIETTGLEDGAKRYRVVDLVEGGSASKNGVYKVRVEAEAVCSLLNTEHPNHRGVTLKDELAVSPLLGSFPQDSIGRWCPRILSGRDRP